MENRFGLNWVPIFLLIAAIVPASMLAQQAPVNLGTAGNYTILSETGITDVSPSVIVGNVASSPITGAAIHLSCTEVVGTISAVDAAGPAPCALQVPVLLTPAIGDMMTAYTNAAGRTIPNFTEFGAGNISGLTLLPGLYKWSTGVFSDSRGFTLSGGPNAVWIFQIAGDLNLASGAQMNLIGGAQANNVFWQLAGPTGATLGTTSRTYGSILSSKQVIMLTGATLIGRAYAFTQVTLQMNSITSPGPLVGGLPALMPPTVTSTVPANLATNVSINTQLSATFSEAMNPATINSGTFTLMNGLTPITGTVSYTGVTATFAPSSTLPSNTLLTATIGTGAQDPQGVALAAPYVWTFTTAAAVSLTPPVVTSTVPANGATGVGITSALSATFSEPLNPLTANAATFTLKQGSTPVLGTVSYSGVTATFTPLTSLTPSTGYTATISTGILDLFGNALAAPYVWSFTTGAAPILTPPTVISTAPANGATGVGTNSGLSATFSEPLNPLTVNTATFTVKQGSTPIAGTVSYSGVTATFTPLTSLGSGILYTATISTGVMDLSGNALAAPYIWNFTTGAAAILTPPTVTMTTPANGATNVSITSSLSATLSEAVNPLTVNSATFTLKQGSTAIPGTVSYSGITATFTPLSSLAPNAVFTATISTGVLDLSGNALAAPYVWNFTTSATASTTPPTVISTAPGNSATNVPIGSAVTATFSEALNPLTVNTATFTLKLGGTAISGTVTYSGVVATFTPSTSLAPGTIYTATITNGVADLSGNALAANYVWSFATASGVISGPPPVLPVIVTTIPNNNEKQAQVTTNLLAIFDEAMNPLTLTTSTFQVFQGGTQIAGTVTYSGSTAIFTPATNLLPNTVYNAVVKGVAADIYGTIMGTDYTWTFTTGTGADITPACEANFAILAGGGVINSGLTMVTGDIGLAGGATISGFPAGTLTGTIHSGDILATQGFADFSAAYADAASRTTGLAVLSGDIGGITLTPGIYASNTGLLMGSGNLTLDGRGDPNGIFIFQTPTLTTTTGRQMILTGKAQPSNVFWQVSTTATLANNSLVQGTLMAGQSITLMPGAVVNGRLATLTGTVTLQSNVIVSPPPGIFLGGVVDAANDSPAVAAGSIASVFGNNLASSLTAVTTYPLPTAIKGTSIQFGVQNAPLYMTSCGQANVQIPWEVAGQTQISITSTVGGLVSAKQPVTIAPYAPGIFALNQQGTGQGAVEIAPTSLVAATQASGSRPVMKGEYIAIFCTGLGPVSNQPPTGAAAPSSPLAVTTTLPTVTIGGVPALVTFSGLAPGFAGLYQVNAQVPSGTASGSSIGVVIGIGGVQSNTVTIAVQ
jgi:uncharacterized protein (TIGR03437 family)